MNAKNSQSDDLYSLDCQLEELRKQLEANYLRHQQESREIKQQLEKLGEMADFMMRGKPIPRKYLRRF
jgi:hypothetical protein